MELINDYIQKEIDVQRRFAGSGLKEYFDIRSNIRWKNSHKYAEFDMALFKNDIVYAIVEVKMNLGFKSMDNAKKQIYNALELTHCRFGIITDNVKFHLLDSASSTPLFVEMSFEQIVQCLIKPEAISPSISGEKNIETKEEIKTILSTCFNANEVSSICEDIKYDENQGFCSFMNVEKEKKFFQLLLKVMDVNKAVYRYTSLETLFTMLSKGTYRMSGIVGMNDKSEIDYFDKECPIDNTGSSIRELNETYLSSCSYLKDDLTMWRLYGDDAKGVCLEFEPVSTEKRYTNFVLAPVSYAKKRGEHIELKMLKALSDANVRFAELNKWKHLFKPYDYNVEKEIRLMFLDNGRYDNGVINRDWVKTWSHSILNPIVDFKLNAPKFPLQLKQILLGPKVPEMEINKSQIEDLISTKGYMIRVEKSEIDNYR